MRIKNRTLNLLYIVTFVLVSGYGLALSLGILEGNLLILPLSYSNLSNIICFSYFFVCLIRGIGIQIAKDGRKEISILPRFKGAVTMCITFTLIIFHFMLFRGSFFLPGTNNLDWRNLMLHYIAPAMVIFHWLVFDKKGIFKPIDSLVWLAIPIGYMVYSFIYAEVGTVFFSNGTERYPYYFINPDRIGWASVAAFVVGLVIFFLLLGYFVCFIDRKLAKLENRQNNN